jgi:hypothetical protein
LGPGALARFEAHLVNFERALSHMNSTLP